MTHEVPHSNDDPRREHESSRTGPVLRADHFETGRPLCVASLPSPSDPLEVAKTRAFDVEIIVIKGRGDDLHRFCVAVSAHDYRFAEAPLLADPVYAT